MAEDTLKERLVRELDLLPEERLLEIVDFVEYIIAKERKKALAESPKELSPEKDPIFELMGIADVEPFSRKEVKQGVGSCLLTFSRRWVPRAYGDEPAGRGFPGGHLPPHALRDRAGV